MANVQVCERCGSIGQARDFLSLNAFLLNGSELRFPQLKTQAQIERELEESMEEDESSGNFTMCRNCREDFRAFLGNAPTESRAAGPIAPKLPSPANPSLQRNPSNESSAESR